MEGGSQLIILVPVSAMFLSQPVISHTPVNMESLPINNGNGQSYGLVLYETFICCGGSLLANVQDTAQVGVSRLSMEVSRTFSLTYWEGLSMVTLLLDNIFKHLLSVRHWEYKVKPKKLAFCFITN